MLPTSPIHPAFLPFPSRPLASPSQLCPVDEHGLYTSEVDSSLQGLSVLDEGSKAGESSLLRKDTTMPPPSLHSHSSHSTHLAPVIEMLRDSKCLLFEEDYSHRCPYDWRTKGAVIVRTTQQWFAAVGGIKAEVRTLT